MQITTWSDPGSDPTTQALSLFFGLPWWQEEGVKHREEAGSGDGGQ